MLLHNKNAIIYGAGGSLGGAVAKALAGAGAKVYTDTPGKGPAIDKKYILACLIPFYV